MKSILLIITLFACSCTHRKDTMSKEQGVVIEKQYFSDTRQTVTGTGFSSNGSLVITSHSVGEDEKYMVIFKCDHGVLFSINSSNLFGKLNRGDTVTIDYYEIVNKKGEIKDLEFIDANKTTNEF